MLEYLKKMEETLRQQPKMPDMLFMTRKTWIMSAKEAIKQGIAVEYRPYLSQNRFRFMGGIPVRIFSECEEGRIYSFNAPRLPYAIQRPIVFSGRVNF